jgi:hypothetical protein
MVLETSTKILRQLCELCIAGKFSQLAQISWRWFPSRNAYNSPGFTLVCHSEKRSDEESGCDFPFLIERIGKSAKQMLHFVQHDTTANAERSQRIRFSLAPFASLREIFRVLVAATAAMRLCGERNLEIQRARMLFLPFEARFNWRANLSSGARQGMHPTLHAALGVLDVFIAEPLFEINFVDRINRTHEVALVTERNCRVDAHAALEHGV